MTDRQATSATMKHLRAYLFPWGVQKPTADEIVDFARTAEELGFEAVHIPWHYTMPKSKSFADFGTRYLLDPTVVVPMIVSATKRLKVGLEFVVPTLHPFHWAQYFASLDRASGGRTLACPVLGWWDEDYKVGMVNPKQRGRRMDEALSTMVKLWAGEKIEKPGEFWDCSGLELDPKPVQQPYPMWIGGGDKSLDRAARWAQALYPLVPTPKEVAETWVPSLRHAEKYGRKLELAIVSYVLATDEAKWLRQYAYPRLLARINGMTHAEARERIDDQTLVQPDKSLMIGTNEQCADRLRALLDAGADHIVIDFYMHGWETPGFGKEQMERFVKEIVPLCATVKA
ncbi:MAG TPA: LLM class flavin-dependent oxidoreductase [Candidatus Limnocylindria bacterium]|nr:LLM class flavin-dependent oxidoreductase [Candidatus Limnocylindria bacterium]